MEAWAEAPLLSPLNPCPPPPDQGYLRPCPGGPASLFGHGHSEEGKFGWTFSLCLVLIASCDLEAHCQDRRRESLSLSLSLLFLYLSCWVVWGVFLLLLFLVVLVGGEWWEVGTCSILDPAGAHQHVH